MCKCSMENEIKTIKVTKKIHRRLMNHKLILNCNTIGQVIEKFYKIYDKLKLGEELRDLE